MSSFAINIAIDIMGGDFGVASTVPAILALANRYPDVQFQLYGESTVDLSTVSPLSNVTVYHCADSVDMNESPVYSLRNKRDSSMGQVLSAVAQGVADGCVSAGNTGALVAMSSYFLGVIEGIERPALCQAIPTEGVSTRSKHTYMLDLGANVDCSAQQLMQFSYLGAALCSILDQNAHPSVRLLNVGTECFKGPSVIQQAADLLVQAPNIDYQGFAEGNDLYRGVADVIVCDGFSGNIALKVSEGVARFVTDSFKQVLQRNFFSRFIAILLKPVFRRWLQSMNPDCYNGAYLLGVQGTVVKSHGGANTQQFSYALEMLIYQLRQQNLCTMSEALKKRMK